jgi:NTP pyrophosphatase (non-canonical NTP hydrolase)
MKQKNPITLSTIQTIFEKKSRELRIPFETLTKKEKDILSKTVKLSEEVGELSNEILSTLSLQRKSKLERSDKKNMYEEFADVILSTVALANSMGVDLDRAVKAKLEKVLTLYTKDK